MSLINEALKKAEQARAGGLSETPVSPVAPVIAKRGRTIGTRTLVLLGVMVLLLVVGGGASLFWKSSEEASAAPQSDPVAKAKPTARQDSASTKPVSTPAVVSPPATAPAPRSEAPASSPPPPSPSAAPPLAEAKSTPASSPPAIIGTGTATVPAPPSPAGALTPASATPPAPLATASPSPAVAPPPAPAISTAPANAAPRADERIAEHIDRLRILGVRSPGPEARVLIGERVYRINDVVDRALGLRLQSVAPGKITFVDAAGVTYTKNY